jgi:hypothetical protein
MGYVVFVHTVVPILMGPKHENFSSRFYTIKPSMGGRLADWKQMSLTLAFDVQLYIRRKSQ